MGTLFTCIGARVRLLVTTVIVLLIPVKAFTPSASREDFGEKKGRERLAATKPINAKKKPHCDGRGKERSGSCGWRNRRASTDMMMGHMRRVDWGGTEIAATGGVPPEGSWRDGRWWPVSDLGTYDPIRTHVGGCDVRPSPIAS